MGEKQSQSILYTSLERWTTEEVKGKCILTPVNDGIDVDLYIFRTDFHYVDGTIAADKEARCSGKEEIREVKKFHRKGKIPYSELGEKIKCW